MAKEVREKPAHSTLMSLFWLMKRAEQVKASAVKVRKDDINAILWLLERYDMETSK